MERLRSFQENVEKIGDDGSSALRRTALRRRMWLTGYRHGVGFLYVLFQQLLTAEGRSARLTLETLYLRRVSLVMLHEFLLCRESRTTRFALRHERKEKASQF